MVKIPGITMVAMLRRSTLPVLSRITFLWKGGGALSRCQRSTRKPRSRRSTTVGLDESIFLRAAEGLGVHERQMREIAEVVDYQQIIRVVVQVGRNTLPLRIAQIGKVDDQRGIRLGGLAQPHPDEMAALDGRVGMYLELRRNHVLSWYLHAL